MKSACSRPPNGGLYLTAGTPPATVKTLSGPATIRSLPQDTAQNVTGRSNLGFSARDAKMQTVHVRTDQ